MKDKPSEWIAISDLMAGVMAVVMLMLVVSVLQKNASEIAYKEELAKSKESKNDPVTKMMQSLNTMINTKSATEFISLDTRTNRMTLRDGVFERGSACLKPEARAAVESVQKYLEDFLRENPKARIFVEGYTDNLPVKSPVVDYQRFCTVYDDNFTLSAARAREARRYLIGALDADAARRIVVAGYGESKPLIGTEPSNPKNRRVEVLFTMEQEAKP
ncbi:MAG: OmpA family protein [Rhodoferax sp.]|uniref:OmpA/MotB family protein n=1 Tax=Rhodoferax sp. TaxID=50421 RepID=UPI00261FC863|nr:OmpA family protein [Rhodoferax sp.]MDD2882857.1 OmpA family protein [Rhodoferax sp.]